MSEVADITHIRRQTLHSYFQLIKMVAENLKHQTLWIQMSDLHETCIFELS